MKLVFRTEFFREGGGSMWILSPSLIVSFWGESLEEAGFKHDGHLWSARALLPQRFSEWAGFMQGMNDWHDMLRNLHDRYTSAGLQHRITEWRGWWIDREKIAQTPLTSYLYEERENS